MAQAGFDPSQMLRVMEILKEASGSRGGSTVFQTHPDPDARIERINEFLKTNYPGGIPSNLERGKSLR